MTVAIDVRLSYLLLLFFLLRFVAVGGRRRYRRGLSLSSYAVLPPAEAAAHRPRQDCPYFRLARKSNIASTCGLVLARALNLCKKKKHCIHVVVTFILQCCFLEIWTTLPEADLFSRVLIFHFSVVVVVVTCCCHRRRRCCHRRRRMFNAKRKAVALMFVPPYLHDAHTRSL